MMTVFRLILANWKLVAIALVVIGAWLWVGQRVRRADAAGYTRSQAEYAAAAELQREANRGRAHKAEVKEVTQTIYRDRYITKTVKEIERVTSSLASCPVPPDAVRLLNDAAKCASEDRPAACGADSAVRSAG